MVHTAIILAGGLGTRLKDVVSDIPKPMAPIAGKPFLAWQIEYIAKQGITDVVLAVSHKREVIQDYFKDSYNGVHIRYSVETQPMGTGGGIKQAFDKVHEDAAIVLNGDSLFTCDIDTLIETHFEKKADITLALKRMQHFDRYGTVTIDEEDYIKSFNEKQPCEDGVINTGVYVINKQVFDSVPHTGAFSFEKDVMEKTGLWRVCGCIQEGYFIDIGIPTDYIRAQTEIPHIIV